MPCGCNRNKNKSKKEKPNKKAISTETYQARRSKCLKCPYAINFISKPGKRTKLLTSRSKCKKKNRILIEALRDPTFKCPVGNF